MHITWNVSKQDARRVREFVHRHRSDPFVRRRADRNLGPRPANVAKSRFWRALVMGLVTTQQRSGPGSMVSRFLSERPFPLGWNLCTRTDDLEGFAERTLTHRRLRRSRVISAELAESFQVLTNGAWPKVHKRLAGLAERRSPTKERDAANLLAHTFQGIGPKQSRNILQSLGLTLHEIPLDSRIIKWLNELGFPLVLTASSLRNPPYYELVLDGVQQLCRQAGVYPCILDAAIFTSYDETDFKRAGPGY